MPEDPLNLSVAEDVIADGKTLVEAGAPAIGRVQHARPARTLGRGAELGLEIQYLKSGQIRVPLRGSQTRQGKGKKGDTVALTVLFGLSGLVKHGSENCGERRIHLYGVCGPGHDGSDAIRITGNGIAMMQTRSNR